MKQISQGSAGRNHRGIRFRSCRRRVAVLPEDLDVALALLFVRKQVERLALLAMMTETSSSGHLRRECSWPVTASRAALCCFLLSGRWGGSCSCPALPAAFREVRRFVVLRVGLGNQTQLKGSAQQHN